MNAQRKLAADSPIPPNPVKPAAPAVPSPADLLRARTDYDNDTGYAPLYFAALAEFPRLSSGLVCTHFLMLVGALSYGRPDKPKRGRQVWTQPVTVEYLASLCRCHVRDIQRQLRDLAKPSAKNPEGRGLIAVKANRRGEYSISPLYRDWAKLPDYVSGPKVVPIDAPEETPEDETPAEVSKDAVRLVRRPLVVKSGRACRSIPFTVGMKDMRVQHSGAVPLILDAVVDGGRLIISTRVEVEGGERMANAPRHGCREQDADTAPRPARADEVIKLFDPLLEKSGARLLIGDSEALRRACEALADMPHDALVHGVMSGNSPRANRAISGPKVVASIIAEVYARWRAGQGKPAKASKPAAPAKAVKAQSFTESVKRAMRRRAVAQDHV